MNNTKTGNEDGIRIHAGKAQWIETFLFGDASQFGISAIILQKADLEESGKIFSYSSSLSRVASKPDSIFATGVL